MIPPPPWPGYRRALPRAWTLPQFTWTLPCLCWKARHTWTSTPPRLVPQQKFPVPSVQTSGHRLAKIQHRVSLAQVLRPAQAFLQWVRALQCKVTVDLQHEVRDTGTSSWAPTTPVSSPWQGSTSPSRQQELAWRAGQQGPVVPTSVQGPHMADVPLPTSDQELLQVGKSRQKQR